MNSNLCDHDTSTSRADGRTDRQTTNKPGLPRRKKIKPDKPDKLNVWIIRADVIEQAFTALTAKQSNCSEIFNGKRRQHTHT